MNYIEEYSDKIRTGELKASKFVIAWYDKILRDLADGKYSFSEEKANHCIKFIEAFCRHHEGALAPNLITLELWQKAFLSVVFGCLDNDGNRQFREVCLVMGRKNGKTLLASAIACYCAYADGEYGARIYMSAPKLQQANLCFDAFFQMVKKDDDLNAISKKRRTDVYIDETNTSISPLAFSVKKSDGLNISLCIADEISSWSGEQGLKFYEVLKSSFGARKQPMLLSISTSGYENEGIYDELIKRATGVISGQSDEQRLAPFIYQIDDLDKWDDLDEVAKANPNINVSITREYLAEEIRIANGSLSKKAEFMTKHCCIKQNSSTAWLDAITVHNACQEDKTFEDFSECYAIGGIDLSQTTDLTACVLLVERDGIIYGFSHFFMPRERMDDNSARDGINYHQHEIQGYLTASGDNFVDYHDVFNWFVELVERYKIYPLKIGYDRYSSQYLVQDLKAYGFHLDDVYQGENLTGCIDEFYGLINDGIVSFQKNPLMEMHLLDSAIKVNSETRRKKLVKIDARKHIDGTAALLDAIAVKQKYCQEIGAQLKNERR